MSHFVMEGDHIWGSGMDPSLTQDDGYPAMLNFHSVRGPVTAKMLERLELIRDAEEIPHGDPGFLVPFLYSQYYHLPTTEGA